MERNLDYFVKPKSHKFTQQTQDDIIKMLDSNISNIKSSKQLNTFILSQEIEQQQAYSYQSSSL
jgi:hypothetical protein